MPFPVRRVMAGFAAGAAAGWVAGLLRTPGAAPADSSAGSTLRLPQLEFGRLPGRPAAPLPPGVQESPAVAEPPPVVEPPAAPADRTAIQQGKPASDDGATRETPTRAVEPAARRARRATTPVDPASAAAGALRAGQEAATGKLVAPPVTPPEPPDPARRRVRRTPPATGGEA